MENEKSIDDLFKDLNDSNWDIRAKAIYLLKDFDNQKVNDALILKLDDINENVWLSAVNVLKDKKDPRIVNKLSKTLLEDKRDEIRWHSAYFLGEIGDASIVEPIIKSLKDNCVEVRVNAAKALGKIGNKKAIFPTII